jgi:hypothetical protein
MGMMQQHSMLSQCALSYGFNAEQLAAEAMALRASSVRFSLQGPPQYPYPYWDPQFQHMAYHQQQQEAGYYQPPIDPHYYSYQQAQPYPYPGPFQYPRAALPSSEAIDEGAEPV